MVELSYDEVQSISGAAWADDTCLDGFMGGMVGGVIAGIPGGPAGMLFSGFGGLIGGAIAGGCFRGMKLY